MPPSWYLVDSGVGMGFRLVQTIGFGNVGRRDFLIGELEAVIRARNGSQPLILDKSPHPSLPQL